MPAPPAHPREWRGAFLAEFGAGFVGLLAARAEHSVRASCTELAGTVAREGRVVK
jgi:hypothetical protein